jgi:phosphohistidine swiveling domain-containing protein
VTVQAAPPQGLVEWAYWHNAWPDRRVLLSRGNSADGYPRPLTPITQDLVLTFENAGVHEFVDDVLKAGKPEHASRPYWTALWGYVFVDADMHADLGAAMPGNSRRATLQRYMGLTPDLAQLEPPQSRVQRMWLAPRRAAVIARMIREGWRAPRRIDDQLRTIRAMRPAGPDVDEAGCLQWLSQLESVHAAAWTTLMIGAGIAGTAFGFTTRLLTTATGRPGGDLANRLHVGVGNNESAEMGHAVRRIAAFALRRPELAEALKAGASLHELRRIDAEFAGQVDEMLDRFGFHTAPELELAQPTWRQQPAQLLEVISRELQRPADNPEQANTSRADAERELRTSVGAARRIPIALALRASRHMMGVRENSKTPAVLIFDELRRVLEFAGPLLVARGSLADPKDAVYLCYEELKGLLGGAAGPSLAELADRKAQLARCGAVQLPDLVEAEPGWVGLPSDAAITSRGMLLPETVEENATVIVGVAASPGRVTGTVAVLCDPFDDFEPGDILVARTVDPGWAATLSCAGAIVLDLGGPMSHGAMVARELGVPCVVGTKVGSLRLTSGMTVTVDGSLGQVLIS